MYRVLWERATGKPVLKESRRAFFERQLFGLRPKNEQKLARGGVFQAEITTLAKDLR